MKKILSVLLFTLIYLCNGESVYACSCPSLPGVTREQEIRAIAKRSDNVVFTGEVISINDDTKSLDYRDITFKVERFWNGEITQEFTIRSDKLNSSCAVDFRIGTSYLVFANLYENHLYTGACSRNKEIAKAAEDLQYLGKGKIQIANKPKDR